MKILVVDDEKNILKLYKAELEDEGYNVVTANSGKEALEVFRAEEPDVVTLDIMMPDIDGIQVLRQLKTGKASDTGYHAHCIRLPRRFFCLGLGCLCGEVVRSGNPESDN